MMVSSAIQKILQDNVKCELKDDPIKMTIWIQITFVAVLVIIGVQHHGQLPQDLLQVAHVIVFQDLGLWAGQARAREAELASIWQR